MGISLGICLVKEPDEKFKLMKNIWDNCKKLNIDIPRDVEDYFNGYAPQDAGVALHKYDLERLGIIETENNDYDACKINIKKLLCLHPDGKYIIVTLDY